MGWEGEGLDFIVFGNLLVIKLRGEEDRKIRVGISIGYSVIKSF